MQIKLFKSRIIDEVKDIMDNPKQIDIYMVYFYCYKHGLFFWRNIIDNYGLCLLCKELGNHEIQTYHIPQHKITSEVWEIVDRKLLEYRFQKFNGDSPFESHKGSDYMKAEFTARIEDGKYNGKIIDIEERLEPYEYTDFIVEFTINKKAIQIKYGCPSNLTYDEKTKKPTSKLAMVLDEFGFKVDFDKEITIEDLKKHFVGKAISSLVANEKSKSGGIFATMKTMTPKL